MTHRPSGSMCQACMYCFTRNCSHLDFATMPTMKRDKDGVIVVKCAEFKKMESVK